jgi:hypothetical protein
MAHKIVHFYLPPLAFLTCAAARVDCSGKRLMVCRKTKEKSSTPTVWNVVGAERTSRHNVTKNIIAVLSSRTL